MWGTGRLAAVTLAAIPLAFAAPAQAAPRAFDDENVPATMTGSVAAIWHPVPGACAASGLCWFSGSVTPTLSGSAGAAAGDRRLLRPHPVRPRTVRRRARVDAASERRARAAEPRVGRSRLLEPGAAAAPPARAGDRAPLRRGEHDRRPQERLRGPPGTGLRAARRLRRPPQRPLLAARHPGGGGRARAT